MCEYNMKINSTMWRWRWRW